MNRSLNLGIFVIALSAFLTHAAPAVGQTSTKDATQKAGESTDAIKSYTVDKKITGILQSGAGGLGNAATRVQNYFVKDGLYAWGGYPDIEDLFIQQARELDPKRRETLLHQIQRQRRPAVVFDMQVALVGIKANGIHGAMNIIGQQGIAEAQ